MSKIIRTAIIMAIVTSCDAVKPIPYLNNGQEWDKSIVVLGDWDGDPETPNTYLHWAPVNAGYDATGEVASKDDHRFGRLYQWGAGDAETNKVAKDRYYNEIKPKFWYTEMDEEVHYTGERWKNGYGPCPQGWRLPTVTEFECLILGKHGGYGWTTSGRYAGFGSYQGSEFFGLNEERTPGTGVFLPAAGQIHSRYGNALLFNNTGAYWTDAAESIDNGPIGNYARAQSSALIFEEDECGILPARHSFGFSVRCVHDVD